MNTIDQQKLSCDLRECESLLETCAKMSDNKQFQHTHLRLLNARATIDRCLEVTVKELDQ